VGLRVNLEAWQQKAWCLAVPSQSLSDVAQVLEAGGPLKQSRTVASESLENREESPGGECDERLHLLRRRRNAAVTRSA
jgi:hypothetical protein